MRPTRRVIRSNTDAESPKDNVIDVARGDGVSYGDLSVVCGSGNPVFEALLKKERKKRELVQGHLAKERAITKKLRSDIKINNDEHSSSIEALKTKAVEQKARTVLDKEVAATVAKKRLTEKIFALDESERIRRELVKGITNHKKENAKGITQTRLLKSKIISLSAALSEAVKNAESLKADRKKMKVSATKAVNVSAEAVTAKRKHELDIASIKLETQKVALQLRLAGDRGGKFHEENEAKKAMITFKIKKSSEAKQADIDRKERARAKKVEEATARCSFQSANAAMQRTTLNGGVFPSMHQREPIQESMQEVRTDFSPF